MSLKLTFRIAFQSDYHVGSGHGMGTEIDSALLRDADGTLVLRGSLLCGILRDGLIALLEQHSMNVWQENHPCQAGGADSATDRYCGQYQAKPVGLLDVCPVCRVFGSPRMTKRWVFGTARPLKQSRIERTSEAYHAKSANSLRVTRARVSPRTRRAAPRKLFSQEQGGQQVFEFVVKCPSNDEAAMDDAALLVAAARMVRQLGRGRRRGIGECILALMEIDPDVERPEGGDVQTWLLERFQKRWLKGSESLAEPGEELQTVKRVREGEKVHVRVIARADEPLLIAQRALAGNQFESQMAITGKTLRGALASLAVGVFDLEQDDTRWAFVDLFLRGAVGFPTLYPMKFEDNKLYPAIPVPSDGFTCKVDQKHGIQWATQDGSLAGRECQFAPPGAQETCGKAVKGVRGRFLPLINDEKPFAPPQRSEMHIQIDHNSGRVREGKVFEYIPLEAGQYFCGELVCQDENAWRVLQQLVGLDPDTEKGKIITVNLGKGRQRGYGRTTLWFDDKYRDEQAVSLWIGQPLRQSGNQAQRGSIPGRMDENANVQEVTMTLLTDTIIADTWGRHITGFENGWIADALQLKGDRVQIVEGIPDELETDRIKVKDCAYASTHLVDGFNGVQRLPRWRDVALLAGSSVRLQVDVDKGLIDRLEYLEQEGIGLRRNEGYGQVAFNHPVYRECKSVQGVSILRNKLPKALRPGLGKEDSLSDMRRKWENELQQQEWGKCAKPKAPKGSFAALARWLAANQMHDPGNLAMVMDVLLAKDEKEREVARSELLELKVQGLNVTLPALGQPDDVLTKDIIKDYGDRDKSNKLLQSDAKEGVELIRKKLVDLSQRPGWESFWPEGIAMIAAQVSKAVKE